MLLAIPFGLAIGIAVGMLGGGGSVLAVPILVYVLGQSVSEATTASLAVVTAGAVAGGLEHARAGRVCWRHAGSFTLAAVPGLVAGTLAGDSVSGTAVLAAFALIMLAAAAATWRNADDDGPADGTWESGGACPPLRLPRDLVAGVLVGFLTGFFGVTTAMTAACVAGALAGAGLSTRVPQRTLGRGFALLACGVAAYLLVSAAFLGGPPAS